MTLTEADRIQNAGINCQRRTNLIQMDTSDELMGPKGEPSALIN